MQHINCHQSIMTFSIALLSCHQKCPFLYYKLYILRKPIDASCYDHGDILARHLVAWWLIYIFFFIFIFMLVDWSFLVEGVCNEWPLPFIRLSRMKMSNSTLKSVDDCCCWCWYSITRTHTLRLTRTVTSRSKCLVMLM